MRTHPSSILADLELAIDAEVGDGPVTDEKLARAVSKTYPGVPEAGIPKIVSQVRAIIADGEALHADWKGRLWADNL